MRSDFRLFNPVDLFNEGRSTRMIKRSHLIAIGICVVILVNVAICAFLYWQKSEIMERKRIEVRNISTLLAQQTNHALQATQISENRIADLIQASGIKSRSDLADWASRRETLSNLKFSADAFSALSSLTILSHDGYVLASSRDPSKNGFNAGSRIDFKADKESNQDVFLDYLSVGRGDGDNDLYMIRKIGGHGKEKLGAILAAIDTKRMEDFFENVAESQGIGTLLFDERGKILVKSSRFDDLICPHACALKSRAAEASAERPKYRATLDAFASIANDDLVHATALPDFPLVLMSRSSDQTVRAQWRDEAAPICILAALLDGVLVLAGALGLRQVHAAREIVRAEANAARHDPLTGMPNRLYLREYLRHMFGRAGDDYDGFVLMIIDLDRFKDINDTYGHQVGDSLLKVVAARLAQVCGPYALAARLGGDEFAVVLQSITSDEDVGDCSENLLAALRQPIILENHTIDIKACIGTAVALRDAKDADEIIDRADLALYKAKKYGRNRVFIYSDAAAARVHERLSLLHDLKESINNRRLELYFQPIVDLADQKIIAFEALLRWNHPTRGFVPPGRFIALAEENGLMGSLGHWILEEACRQAQLWPDDIGVSVNLSPVQLQMRDVHADVSAALRASGLSASRLEIEITESVHLESQSAGSTLRRLRAQGVRIALDDFGTGYSSLSYLSSFPFDRIKIEQSFVREMRKSRECSIIVKNVLDLSRNLRLSVTAEGVETLDQLNFLRTSSCSAAQGYLLGRPMPSHEIRDFLTTWRFPGSERTAPNLYVI